MSHLSCYTNIDTGLAGLSNDQLLCVSIMRVYMFLLFMASGSDSSALHTPLYDTFCTKWSYHFLFRECLGNSYLITPQGYASGLSGTPCVIDAMHINSKYLCSNSLMKCFAVF